MAESERYRDKQEMHERFEQRVQERGLEQCVADLDAANKKFTEGVERITERIRMANARFNERLAFLGREL